MARCSNCHHSLDSHNERGCLKVAHDDLACLCVWKKTAEGFNVEVAPSTLAPCAIEQKAAAAGEPDLRCEILIAHGKPHSGDHRMGDWRWAGCTTCRNMLAGRCSDCTYEPKGSSMGARCDNCHHRSDNHGVAGCKVLVTEGFPCPCAWTRAQGTKTLLRAGVDLEQCQARNAQQMSMQCDLRVSPVARHTCNHRMIGAGGVITRWAEVVAVYPAIQDKPADHTQVGGKHYSEMTIQPWAVIEALDLDFFQGNALKYLMRAGRKGPALEDLKKARHYIDKCIEREEARG